jgi:ABC-type glycerol-3-phosphate transport system substrate-binding protein
MKRVFWAAAAGLLLLAGCGAESPPRAEGGIDLTGFWAGAE